jgi:chaperone BCS1
MQNASSHSPGGRSMRTSRDTIRISTLRCFPGSILSDFLEFVQKPNKVAAETKTAVAYVEPKTYVQWDEPDHWQYQARTSRALSTIDLDPKVKDDLIKTVDQFVAPERAAWYHQRGIPYLFGALFHGEPGTGKSSTAFTLASRLKKTLYTLNIKEVLDEQHLRKLFRQPSAGDIILIEDIDSAGLQREMMVPGTNHEDSSKVSYDEGESSKPKQKRSVITVQGLLNAIDTRNEDVAFIMTTNRPDTLDLALVQPGRVEKKVHFDCATKSIAEHIFSRMYQNSPVDDVSELAREFASPIPDGRLTPADIQGHLLSHPTPGAAVAAAKEWVEEELQRKAAKRNVSESLEAHHKPGVRPFTFLSMFPSTLAIPLRISLTYTRNVQDPVPISF